MSTIRVAVVDDDPTTCSSLVKVLASEGYEVSGFTDGLAALEAVRSQPVDVVISDVVMSPLSGIELLRSVLTEELDVVVILVTGYGDIPSAVEAVKEGAFDYMPKPVDVERLCIQVEKAGRQARLRRENRELRRQLTCQRSGCGMVGRSAAIETLRRDTLRAASTDATVLITGESGVGKELVARALHQQGSRTGRPFIAVNCGAIPSTLIESEFFGHERGAFTGALRQHTGRFEQADRGTLFLDEIGDLEPQVQVKLLRALEERCFERVGGHQTVRVDVRLVAATRHDLEERARAGLFREDLFYRLRVIALHVCPLRERPEDIPLLVSHFAKQLSGFYSRSDLEFTSEALGALVRYAWPGNVRELRNCIESLVVMGQDPRVAIDDLPARVRGTAADSVPVDTVTHCGTLAEVERAVILATLAQVDGNRRRAAEHLGIGLKTLYRRLHVYGVIDGPSDEGAVSN